MGEHRNGKLATSLGWTTVGLMSFCAIIGLWQTVIGG
jgi:Mn2+/Fe2+ NRAMP family transporter